MWLCRYLKPTIITYDHGNGFLSHIFENDLTKNELGIKSKSANTLNCQENSILEGFAKS